MSTGVLRRARRCSVLISLLVCFCFAGGGVMTRATDWPQYRGPTHDQHTPDVIRTDWAQQPPKVLWRIPLGESFGSFAVKGDRAYVFVKDGENESCIAFDAASGNELWRRPTGRTILNERQGGDGPRSTPTLVGDRV